MKLLLDENLSHRLVAIAQEAFPEMQHVRGVGLRGASDQRIWEFARDGGFIIVSKDADFRQRSFVHGPPPKVVWLDVGNAQTAEIAALMLRSRGSLEEFASSLEGALLVLSVARGAP